MSLMANSVVRMSEAQTAEGDPLVPLDPIVYGIIAFSLLMVLLLVTTRLDLDR